MVCALATLPHAYRGSRRPKPHYCFLASFFGVGYPFVLAVILPVVWIYHSTFLLNANKAANIYQ